MRRRKSYLLIFGIALCTFIIHSYVTETQKEAEFPELLYGIPTYQNSRLSTAMSSFSANPFTAVFLTNDSYEKVIAFFKEKLPNATYKELTYGTTIKGVTIYQFEIEKGILPNQINKGVEIVPYNHFNQRVFKAKTKIKIIIPQDEVQEANQNTSENSEPEE